MKLLLNPLSAITQFHTANELGNALGELIDCLKYYTPALISGNIQLFYDPRIEDRCLMHGIAINKSINNLPHTQRSADDLRLWYIFTKNRAQGLDWENGIEAVVRSKNTGTLQVSGEIHDLSLLNECTWIGWTGHNLFDEKVLAVQSAGNEYTKLNIATMEHAVFHAPSYEPNPKHRREDYSVGGEFISAMPLSTEDANTLLLQSVCIDVDGDRWAYHDIRSEYYRFKHTSFDENLFHGFRVEWDSIPADAQRQLSERNNR